MVADYYAILEVDPHADRETIESALGRAQPRWSAGTRNPKNKHTFQSYLDRIPAIRQALLGDPSSRAAYDAELAAARRAEHDAKLDRLHRLVRLRASKGGLTVSDRSILRDEATRLGLTPEDLSRLAQPYPPMPEAPTSSDEADPAPDILDAAPRRQIRIALDHIRRRDLYDALGLPRDAPSPEIASRADLERQSWMRKAQVTAEKTAWLEVISYAQSHLSAPEARARYDRTLDFDAEEAFAESVAFAVKGTAALAGATRDHLRDEATMVGITAERADRLIDRTCRALGISRDGPSATTRSNGMVRYLRCRQCVGLTEYALASRSSETAQCRHCRAPLRWDCPVCRRARWVDEPRCACGFALEHVEPLVRYFEAAQHAHRARDFESAIACLRRVQEYAPRHIGARKGIEKIKERLAEIDQARAAYEAERSRRHLVAARGALLTWGRLIDPSTPALRRAASEVAEGLRQAMALSAKARAIAEEDPRGARTLFRQALTIAADLPEALDGLRHGPPLPPTDLHATIAPDRVRLSWTASPGDGLGPCLYRVTRKRGAIPQHADDGVDLGESDSNEFDDTSATPGDTVAYAVYAVRGGSTSLTGATVGPVPVLSDVANLRAESASREVLLTWTTPPNCFDVRVVRKLGAAPIGPEDGTPVAALPGQALDRGLADEAVYHYGVFVLYRAADGRLISSRGAFASAMPAVPVATVIEATLTRSPAGPLRIAWTPPEKGHVQVLRTTRPVPHSAGDSVDRRAIEAIEGAWLPRSAPDHAVDRSPPPRLSLFYTPVIAWAGKFTLGRTVPYAHVPDPTGVRASRSGKSGKVVLRWTWPEGVESAVVAARRGDYPASPDDPSATTVEIREGDYQRQGSLAISLPPGEGGAWHVVVLAMAEVGGRRVVSPGLEPSCRALVPGRSSEVELSYAIWPPTLLRRSWNLTIRTDPPRAEVPALVVVAHPRSVPLNVDDGEVVARVPPSRDGDRHAFKADVDPSKHRLRAFVDPSTEPTGAMPIRLVHPGTESTRV